jgi:hypothetical protein
MKRTQFMTMVFWWWVILGIPALSFAALDDPLTTIELDTPVHFLAPDGSNVLIEAGTYAVEPAEEWIRVMSGERRDAVLIESRKGTHELELPETLVLSVTGTEDEGQDLHHLIVLLQNGESLEATGTYSGIRPRGFFDQAVNNVKKKANQAHKKAQSTAKKTVSQANSTAQQAQQQTQQAVSSAKQGIQNSRNAALQAKQDVEKAAKRMTTIAKFPSSMAQPLTGKSNQWSWWSQIAIANASKEAEDWLRQVYIDRSKCKVMSTTAIGTAGVLKSRYAFQDKIRKGLQAAGAPDAVSRGWDKGFKDAWENWATSVMIPGLPWYPAFTAFPGPQAPPTPNVPTPLSTLPSAGAQGMTPPALAKKVESSMGVAANTQEAKNAVKRFATDLGGRFVMCLGNCILINVMGSGPIPTFAPPMIPVGPVVNGSCSGGVIPTIMGFNQPVPSLKDPGSR